LPELRLNRSCFNVNPSAAWLLHEPAATDNHFLWQKRMKTVALPIHIKASDMSTICQEYSLSHMLHVQHLFFSNYMILNDTQCKPNGI